MARNGDRSPIQKRLPDVGTEQLSKSLSDNEEQHSSCSSSPNSSSSGSTTATRRRPWKVSPAASLSAGAGGSLKDETQVTQPNSKSNSNRHLLLLRRHSAIFPHRLRRDFRSFCFCCFCCCSCSCTDIFAHRPSGSQMAGTSGDQKKSTALSSITSKKPQIKEKSADPSITAGQENLDSEPLPSVEEIRMWGESFDQLMKCAAGRQLFRKFLQCEYSEENILFWLACEELKRECNPEAIEEKARLIYEDYVSILSPREVSLDSKVREIVNQNMLRPTVNTFDEAQLQIYTLMHRDSYPRFLNSSLYRSVAQLSPTSAKSSVKVG